ncbi:helix-turn-helix domain-containing protein [Arthrobacter ramosus]|nr:helix-turn-helix domain-containing protein [Arthrobacter ramosus]
MTPSQPRFMKLHDVAEELNISQAQAYGLVRSGKLPAIQVGGRNQWRVERVKFEEFIARMYELTGDHVSELAEHREPPLAE